MQIVDGIIVLALIVLAFIAGLRLDNYYHVRMSLGVKEALEKQFLRLRAGADADDPCKPYGTPQVFQPLPLHTGDYDGDGPINQQFMDNLKATGHAKTSFRKSDVAK